MSAVDTPVGHEAARRRGDHAGVVARTAAVFSQRAVRRTLRGTLLLGTPLFVLAVVAETTFPPADLRVTTNFLIAIVLVLAIQIFSGNSGIISFGHVAFMGIGAYVAALAATPRDLKELSVPHLPEWLMGMELGFLPSVAAAGAVSAVIALAIGGALVRMRETAMAMATFAILVIFSVIFSSWNRITGGAAGIYGIPGRVNVWWALAFVFVAIVVARAYRESRAGLKVRASREDPLAAAALGAPVRRLRLGTWVLSAAVMGIGGGIWAQYNLAFGPQQFDFTQTFNLLAMLVVGGLASVSGAVVGATVITVVTEVLRRIEDSIHVEGLTEIVVALTILVSLRARPLGLVGLQELDEMILRSRALRRLRATGGVFARSTRRSRAYRARTVAFASRLVDVGDATLEMWEAGEGALTAVYQQPYEISEPPSPGGAFADALAHGGRAVVVAPRGIGRSSTASSPAQLGLAQSVTDLDALRRALDLERWIVAGSALGGAVALEYALRYPGATAGLVLSSAAPSWRFYEDPDSICSPLNPQAWREEEARRALDGSEAASRAWLRTVLSLSMRNRSTLDWIVATTHVSVPRLQALRRDLLGDPPWDVEARLDEIVCPSLVVAGRHDALVPPRFAELLHERLPRSELVIFESGHRTAEEEPEELRTVVATFFAGVRDSIEGPEAHDA